MSEAFWPLILIAAAVVIWVLAKVYANIRKSERQWREVDRSKLREWEDDDDW